MRVSKSKALDAAVKEIELQGVASSTALVRSCDAQTANRLDELSEAHEN